MTAAAPPPPPVQADVGEVCGLSELVSQALEGYNVTIFAFGQTGGCAALGVGC